MDVMADSPSASHEEVLRRRQLTLRPATHDDAAAWLVFLQKLDLDTGFMLFEPGERVASIAKCEEATYHRSTARVVRIIHALGEAMWANRSLFSRRGTEILDQAENASREAVRDFGIALDVQHA